MSTDLEVLESPEKKKSISPEERQILMDEFDVEMKKINQIFYVSSHLRFFYFLFSTLKKKEVITKYDIMGTELANRARIPGGFVNNLDELYLITDKNIHHKEVLMIILHELIHVLFGHAHRIEGRNPLIWNLAIDQTTNGMLYDMNEGLKAEKYNYYIIPDNIFFIKELHESVTKNLKSEEVYNIFMKDENRFTVLETNCPELLKGCNGSKTAKTGDGDSPEVGADEDGNGGIKVPYAKVKDNKTGEIFDIILDGLNQNTQPQEQIEEKFKEIFYKSSAYWNNESSNLKGDMPGNIKELFNRLFEVKIPWDSIFESAILYSISNRSDYSWSQPNIYLRRFGFKLPGENDMSTDLVTIVAGIDTSGSISHENIEKFFNILINAGEYYDKIIIFVHDHVVADTMILENFRDNHKEIIFKKMQEHGIKGRGGTSHKDLFDKIQEIEEDELISSIVFLTDFESDVQHIAGNYPFLKNNETIWLLVDNKKEYVNIPDPTDQIKYKVIEINSTQ